MALNDDIVTEAKTWIGVPYVHGGASRQGADCSGFVQAVFAKFGIKLNRTTIEQLQQPLTIPNYSDTLPGDCIYFGTADDNATQHMGILLGLGSMIDSNHPGGGVGIRPILGYGHIIGYRRFWSGNIIPLLAAGPSEGISVPSVPSIPGVDELTQLVSIPVKAGQWLADRRHIVRVIEGIIGTMALVIGVLMVNASTVEEVGSKVVNVGKKAAELGAVA